MTTNPLIRTTPNPFSPKEADATTSTRPASDRAQALGSDAFLQLLVLKLRNQDPTNPQTDTDFIAQLATFSSLEQLTSIKRAIDDLSAKLTPATSTSGKNATSTNTGTTSTNTGTTPTEKGHA